MYEYIIICIKLKAKIKLFRVYTNVSTICVVLLTILVSPKALSDKFRHLKLQFNTVWYANSDSMKLNYNSHAPQSGVHSVRRV